MHRLPMRSFRTSTPPAIPYTAVRKGASITAITTITAIGSERIRRKGAGRKKAIDQQPTQIADLERLVDPGTRGDPESPLRWTSKSVRKLADELQQHGHPVSYETVAALLRKMDYSLYSLQANRKTLEGDRHADRDAQFEHINAKARQYLADGDPVISVDTKKKEQVGDFKNGGPELQPEGKPEKVRVHDFRIPELGKVAPYGVYDLGRNVGWVNVGVDHDTAAFAVASIRGWWYCMGLANYAHASKWNKIEHRLFSFITQNWRDKPLVSHEVIINLVPGGKWQTEISRPVSSARLCSSHFQSLTRAPWLPPESAVMSSRLIRRHRNQEGAEGDQPTG